LNGNGDRVAVIGAGVAGLVTALSLSPLPVVLFTCGHLPSDAATAWAQGGIAAAMGEDDAPELHAADTLAAGAGLSEPHVARMVARDAADGIAALAAWGVSFDRDTGGALALGLEGAHSRRRILHAGGDGSGVAILSALLAAARASASIEIVEGFQATDIVLRDGRAVGIAGSKAGRSTVLAARAVVLATGGVGGLYAATTNPRGAVGSGLALAARTGAVLRDIEFVQFHPTAMALGGDPMPLATEALRGEGAQLVDAGGNRIMAEVRGGDLAPRDIVSRAVWARMAAGETVYLDGRTAIGAAFSRRLPTVTRYCHAAGLDPATQPIPVRPAAHYHMGGIRVDTRGRSSVPRLWACGEVAATGLHGANRLASNSLLEAVVYGRRVAADICGQTFPAGQYISTRERPTSSTEGNAYNERLPQVRSLMDRCVGVVRDHDGLGTARHRLARMARDPALTASDADTALVALLIAEAALRRRESRGGHYRRDYPDTSSAWRRHGDITLAEIAALDEAAELSGESV
jgi:L-aspartate oxidase